MVRFSNREKKWIEDHKDLIDSRDYHSIFVESQTSIHYLGYKLNEAFLELGITPEELIYQGFTKIPPEYFHNCTSLRSITIPNSVTSIGYMAFYYCTSLTSVTIPNSVTSIGNDAFNGCSKLESIAYGGTIAQWKEISKSHNWNEEVPAIKVKCSNGEVML